MTELVDTSEDLRLDGEDLDQDNEVLNDDLLNDDQDLLMGDNDNGPQGNGSVIGGGVGVGGGNNSLGNIGNMTDDPEIEAIKARVREMEEEAEKLKQLQNEVDKQMNMGAATDSGASPLNMSFEDKVEADNRSIYVGNVDYGSTAEELEQHFHGCGSINRVTILCNKFDGHPKGFAYIEFVDRDSVQMAMAMDESLFRGRQIKVMPKRTNKPGLSTTNRPPRGTRGMFAMRGGRGAMMAARGSSYMPYVSSFRPSRRMRMYARRGGYYAPY